MMYNTYLYHHGIKGQKWGIRRFQNEDGSLTDKGNHRYSKDVDKRDKSLKTVAAVRTGEARRKYEFAKMKNASNKKDLKEEYKIAKKDEKEIRKAAKGERQLERGKTIGKNRGKELATIGAATAGTVAFRSAMNKRMVNEVLKDDMDVGKLMTDRKMKLIGTAVIATAGTAYVVNKSRKNSQMNKYKKMDDQGKMTTKFAKSGKK